MRITPETKGIIKNDFQYRFDGNLETKEDLVIDLDGGLYVTGSIKAEGSISADFWIKAGGSIRAGGSIEAGCWIESGGSIESGDSIEAGGSIESGGSIKAGDWIKAGASIKAGDSIRSGDSIEAGGSIESGGSIEAGLGITAFLSITCKETLKAGARIIAGICDWEEITDEDRTITCKKLLSGEVIVGILKETGLKEKVEKIEPDSKEKIEKQISLLEDLIRDLKKRLS